jgi:signal transduction histidine kinase
VRHQRHFNSLNDAIRENGISRVYLGVHWSFDAFGAAADYSDNIGGVPLGLAIANELADQLNADAFVESSLSAER